MLVFVTGATGTVGRLVLPHLIEAGAQVRALTRNPDSANFPTEIETVQGDLEQPDGLRAAFEGVDALYLIVAGERSAEVIDLAKAAGVKRIVTLSSASAGFEDNPGGNYHRDFEVAVESSGLGWTHVRPGMFATNLLDWAEAIKSTRTVRAPYDAARQAPVHEKDVAGVAAAALLDDSHVGCIYTLSGPESLTKSEQIDAISTALGELVRFEEVTPEQWREENGAYVPDYVLDWLQSYWQNALTTPEPVLPDVENVLGRPSTPLIDWARDHQDDFR
ncbi:Uncharacterized conserved protein YbjT, contains NAD(P)-binding and DUF2867 domains [Brevibacterium aurantiacum]|uniref:Uncharacterized conserved protein YbjT, contains NAD(P)-binding and DUF2867 domains n=1 Tax=Brevibacterium aurantiacum TaxID=273384 RepID=A0A2H1IRG8_BREAU|nr:NAD(P)H-binding protein [Brevibacterium aurantiacum]SMX77797.1 Uncharacterized conserved protein YbjT, contains NAD(P)-binding and DUF2867 domains [Brevibacterium aurantiacum]